MAFSIIKVNCRAFYAMFHFFFFFSDGECAAFQGCPQTVVGDQSQADCPRGMRGCQTCHCDAAEEGNGGVWRFDLNGCEVLSKQFQQKKETLKKKYVHLVWSRFELKK